MSHNVPWDRPYVGVSKLSPDKMKRITVELPIEDANVIVAVTLNPLILTTICQYAIKHTAAFVRANQVTYAKPGPFLDFICKRSAGVPPEETPPPDVTGGEKGVRTGVAHAGDVAAGTREAVKKVRGGKEDKGRGKA